jgi:hypothetical protein
LAYNLGNLMRRETARATREPWSLSDRPGRSSLRGAVQEPTSTPPTAVKQLPATA